MSGEPPRGTASVSGATARDTGDAQRRTHAERSAETRARIIAAVVDCIAEIGYPRTTASEIAARSGVTWGAVQHHFGGKDGILAAVLEESFARFERRFDDVPTEATSLEERAGLFVERAWQHFASSHYRSTFEILLSHAPRNPAGLAAPEWQRTMFSAWDGVFRRLFADSPIAGRERRHLEHYVLSTLAGLAATRMLAPAADPLPAAELELLVDVLVRGLRGRPAGT